MRYLFVVLALVFAGCSTVQRPSSVVAHNYLEAKALDYQHFQESRVHAVSLRLLSQIPNPPDVAFIVAPGEPSINAGTTYGKVVITSGLVKFANTDDELAVVIGHELAHHTQGHLTTQTVSSVLITAVAVVANAYAPGVGGSVQQLGQAFYSHYNQSQELEADAVGMRYAAAAGYDPGAGPKFFERMAIEVPQTLTASFFASHPSSPERMVAAQQQTALLLVQGYAPQPNNQESSQVVTRTTPAAPSPTRPISAPPVTVTVPSAYPAAPSAPAAAFVPVASSSPQPSQPRDPTVMQAYNPMTSADTQLRNAEREFRAGRMSLEEFRSIKKVLQPAP